MYTKLAKNTRIIKREIKIGLFLFFFFNNYYASVYNHEKNKIII